VWVCANIWSGSSSSWVRRGEAYSYRAPGLSVRYGSPGIGGSVGGGDGGALRSHPVGYTLLILNIYSAAMCSTLGGISRLPGFSCARIYYY